MTYRRWNEGQYSTQLSFQGQKRQDLGHLKVAVTLAAIHEIYFPRLPAEDGNERRKRHCLWLQGRCQAGLQDAGIQGKKVVDMETRVRVLSSSPTIGEPA